MLRPRFAILTLFSLLMIAANARAVDKGKLRRAVSLPQICVIVGYGVNRRGEFMNGAGATLQSEKIAENAHRKAVSLLRKQLEQHPDDLTCLLRLADTLSDVEELDEAETLARRAVKDYPNDWHAWLGLGEILDSKCCHAITGGKSLRPTSPEALLQSMREIQPTSKRIAASRRYRREAVACFDRAVTLAPRTSEPYRLRGASRYAYSFLDLGLRLYEGKKGEKADFVECFLGRAAMPDLRKAIDLSHDNYIGIGMVVLMEAQAEIQDYLVRNPTAKQPKKLLDILSESTRKHLREDMTRLEKGVQNPDKHKAAEAAEVQSWLQVFLLYDFAAAEKSARQSIAFDPTREAAWDILFNCGMKLKTYRKVVTDSRQRLKNRDSARNRLLLAKAYEYLDQLDKAEAVIRVGLNHEADDFMLNLALANLLLMRGDEENLNQAGQSLYKMRTAKLTDGGSENRWANYTFACGVYFGLSGTSERAHECFEKVQQHQPAYPRIKEALEALDEPSEPVSPRPQP